MGCGKSWKMMFMEKLTKKEFFKIIKKQEDEQLKK